MKPTKHAVQINNKDQTKNNYHRKNDRPTEAWIDDRNESDKYSK